MNLKKLLTLVFVFMISAMNMYAQPNDYSKNWKTVEAFEKKGLTKSALQEVMKIFDLAVASGNEVQQVKSAMYQMKYRNMVEEDNKENNIFFIDTLVAKTKAPAKNILQSMQAELFFAYRQNNRYKFYSRTKLTAEKSKDITTWSIDKLNATIASLYKASLKNETVLKNTSLNGMDAILQKGENTRNLRPTVYDFLVHRALGYFMNDENDITEPSYKFILNDERIFLPAAEFIKTKFITKDSSSLYYNALILFQDILKFHINDANPDALIDADIARLDFVNEHGIFTNKDNLYEAALKNIENHFNKNPSAAQAMYLRAQLYFRKGSEFNAQVKKESQYEIKRAKELCDTVISNFPRSEGAINCRNLLAQIKMPSLNMETEKVNIPNKPFRSLVKYKNINRLYLRVIKTTKEEIDRINQSEYEQNWKQTAGLKSFRSWDIALPNLQDYQQHSVEIKVDALPIGAYLILASIDPDFSLSNNIIAKQVVTVSNISYIINNKDELYILHRDNGQPLEKAVVQLWEHNYNYNSRKYENSKKEKYSSDANGFIKVKQTKNSYNNNYIQVNYNSDELFLDDNIVSYYYNSYETPSAKRTFLFTDRSIYRPGQTIFFKGIVVSTDISTKKSKIETGYKTRVILFDANSQKLGSIELKTGEYGSYSGSFKLPEGLLNGSFYIQDSANNSTQNFNVEEYKRPKFFVEVSKPKGTYRLNDSITVKGNAKAYAGNNIDGAKVTYRVVRKVRYPVWWGGYYSRGKIAFPGNSEEMEISNGETTTNAAGEFNIVFKAIPDETVDKKNQPVFHYEVSADITDINGETRSGNTDVAVAYQMLQLDIASAEKMEADSIRNIKIRSTNLNGIFEKTTVNISLYKLRSPKLIFRERYWEVPDQFLMSFDDFKTNFPYDAYSDEDQMKKWPLGEIGLELTDTTSESGEISLRNGQLKTGWYKLIATTKDKYGEEVSAEKYILIVDGNGFDGENKSTLNVIVRNASAEPGERISYTVATDFDKVWLIHNLTKADRSTNTSYQTITAQAPYNNEIAITENDRGGIYLDAAFVQHNRVYTGSKYIDVAWSNKDLNISYETFRDKLLPGAEEKWKIKISGNKAEKTAAETLISMYDASLDQFKTHNWVSLKSIWPVNAGYMNWRNGGFAAVNSDEYNKMNYEGEQQKPKSYDALANYGWNERFYYRDRILLRGQGNAMAVAAMPDQMNVAEEDKSSSKQMKAPKFIQGDFKAKSDTNEYNMTTGKSLTGGLINDNVQIRKNFNETAFFFPSLLTDANGNIEFSFIIPEALTQWKMMTLAHSKDLSSAYSEKTVITQKTLMIQPNAPRFLREGDQIEFSAKVVNLSNKELTGTAQLELFDAATNKPVDGWFKNVFPTQYFTVPAGQSAAVKFPVGIPANFNSALTYRIKAITKDAAYSDGEEAALPVLTNRMLITESMPLNLRNETTKNFKFDKLLNSAKSETLSNYSLTVEYTSNPAWYAVQALPFLIDYPYECAEQTFNRYYANTLAGFVANSTPKIKALFESWKTLDTAALMSNLQKNEELKSVLLQETPWVMEAKNEAQQKKNIALLFDMVRMAKEKSNAFNKLKEMQSSNGGFTWFKGGPDDRYMTQYIITGIGHLRKLSALNKEDVANVRSVIDKAIPYLDARLKEDYDYLVKHKINLTQNNLSTIAIQYLYMRSFFTETKIGANAQVAYDYYRSQSQKYWLANSRYMQAMIALSLHRSNDAKTPAAIIKSLKENAIYKDEMGMYWKEFTTGGYYWHQAPVESQAMMVEAFTDIDKNNKTIDDLKTWLLKQKQTQNWKTTKATAEACYALLLNGSNWLNEEKEVVINVGGTTIKSSDDKTEAGTGYFKKTIEGDKVKPEMGNITVQTNTSADQHISTSASWGAVYWQYFENLDKITSAETPLKLVKKLFIEKNSDRGPILQPLKDNDELHIGDKIKVRIELRVDRDMEYIHMKDMRASCMEPVNVISEYKWQGGLGYYESTKDASTNFFFGKLPRGTYVFEYPMFVTHAGNFSNGVTTIQCMYAPEFTSHSEGVRVSVE